MLATPRARAIRELIKDAIITADLDDARGVVLLELVDSITVAPTRKILQDTLERAEVAYLLACGWTRATGNEREGMVPIVSGAGQPTPGDRYGLTANGAPAILHKPKRGEWLPPRSVLIPGSEIPHAGGDSRVYRDVPHAINSQRSRENRHKATQVTTEDD